MARASRMGELDARDRLLFPRDLRVVGPRDRAGATRWQVAPGWFRELVSGLVLLGALADPVDHHLNFVVREGIALGGHRGAEAEGAHAAQRTPARRRARGAPDQLVDDV